MQYLETQGLIILGGKMQDLQYVYPVLSEVLSATSAIACQNSNTIVLAHFFPSNIKCTGNQSMRNSMAEYKTKFCNIIKLQRYFVEQKYQTFAPSGFTNVKVCF